MSAVRPESTRRAERAMAPLWMAALRSPEVNEALDRLGLEAREHYFPVRAAPLGPAPLEVVVATFFNFSPRAVGGAIPRAWDKATPAQMLEAQLAGIDVSLRHAFESLEPGVVKEALDLLRPAAEAAAQRPEGRPLFAGYASLPWPDEPHVALWHAHYLLREFRGDGHIAVLTAEGLTGIEALAIHIAQMPAIGEIFRQSAGGPTTSGTRRSTSSAPRVGSRPTTSRSPTRVPVVARRSRSAPTSSTCRPTPPSAKRARIARSSSAS